MNCFTFTLLLFVLVFPCATSNSTSYPWKRIFDSFARKRLTLEQFSTILHTEIGEELDFASPEVDIFWKDLVEYQWSRNINLTETSDYDVSLPYIICSEIPGLTGIERLEKLNDDIDEAEQTTDSSILDDTSSAPILYNKEDRICVNLQLTMAVVAQLATSDDNDDAYKIVPVMPQTTITGSMMTSLNRLIADKHITEFPEIFLKFCNDNSFENRTEEEIQTDLITFITSPDILDKSFWGNTDNNYTDPSIITAKHFWTNAVNKGMNAAGSACKDAVKMVDFVFDSSSSMVTISIPNSFDIFKQFDPNYINSILNCGISVIFGLSLIDEVCYVGVNTPVEASNAQPQWLIQSGIENERPWFDVGIDGKNQVVACSDTGIDLDNCYFWDKSGDVLGSHERFDLTRRKVVEYNSFEDTDNLDFEMGHGTHVAGIIAGKRAVDGIDETTGYAEGVAPGAKIAFFDLAKEKDMWGNAKFSLPSTEALLNTGNDAGAKLHSASWGGSGNNYAPRCVEIDTHSYDNDDFLLIVAAGNDGNNPNDNNFNSIRWPASCKNIIAVGSGQSFGDDLKKGMLGPNYLASSSSKGETYDKRTKPDIIAPGNYIVSAAARPGEVGECDGAKYPGPNEDVGGTRSTTGTSMAAPTVSGTAAMIRQYFEEGWYPTGKKDPNNVMIPSGALVKAVLLNGAQYMIGVDNGGSVYPVVPYDNIQNFGRISLMDSLYIPTKTNVEAYAVDAELVNGETHIYPFTIDGNCTSINVLSATLVWTDFPGTIDCANCLINDIDLMVKKVNSSDDQGVDIYYPNGLKGPDRINNAERIRLDGRKGEEFDGDINKGDKFVVHVKAHNFAKTSQKYALVVTGCFGGVMNGLDYNDSVFVSNGKTGTTGTQWWIYILVALSVSTTAVALLVVKRKWVLEKYHVCTQKYGHSDENMQEDATLDQPFLIRRIT